MSKYLLDTCFILGLYRQNPQAIALMQGVMFSQCAVSVVNRIELLGYHGISDSDDIQLRQFLRHVECLEIDRAVQDKAIALRRIHNIKLADSLVLATALTHGLTLLTLDKSLQHKFLNATV
jgi:pilT protein domain protein